MKIQMKIAELNYGDVVIRALPLLHSKRQEQDSALSMLLAAMTRLPKELIYEMFDAIPQTEKNGIVAAFVRENQSQLQNTVNNLLQSSGLGVTLGEFAIGSELELEAEVVNIDYLCLVEKFLPMVKEKLSSMGGMMAMLRPMIAGATAQKICGLLDRIPDEKKEALAVSLLNQNSRKLMDLLEDAAAKQQIRLRVESLLAQE